MKKIFSNEKKKKKIRRNEEKKFFCFLSGHSIKRGDSPESKSTNTSANAKKKEAF